MTHHNDEDDDDDDEDEREVQNVQINIKQTI